MIAVLDSDVLSPENGTEAPPARLTPGTWCAMPAQAMSDDRLKRADWRVLSAVAYHADAAGYAFPAQSTLADLTGLSRQRVNRTVKRLVQLGYLKKRPLPQRRGRFRNMGYCVAREPPPNRVTPVGDTDRVTPVGDSTVSPPWVTQTDQ